MVIAVVSIMVIGGVAGLYVYSLRRASTGNAASTCSGPDSIWSHVYNPDRLEVVKQCITVSGAVEHVIPEGDGEYRLLLRLDIAYANLTNDVNNRDQHGDLVVEIICARTVTRSDAAAACDNYANTILIPTVDQHVTVSGPYVLDNGHDGWAEIHPVYSLTLS